MKAMSYPLILVVVVCLVLPQVSSATQVVARTDQQLGGQATQVVRGHVSSVRSFWNPQHTRIFTETMISVDETYKGAQSSSVRLLQPGGVADGVRMTVSGALHWTAGEEVLLFLEPYVDGAQQVSGFSQGKFHIERDPDTGKPFVRRPALGGAEFVSSRGGPAVPAPAPMENVPLDRFIDRALGGSR